jgi:hypothetical protein
LLTSATSTYRSRSTTGMARSFDPQLSQATCQRSAEGFAVLGQLP